MRQLRQLWPGQVRRDQKNLIHEQTTFQQDLHLVIKRFLEGLFAASARLNHKNILSSVPLLPGGKLLDLGCDDGQWTLRIAAQMRTKDIHAIEIIAQRGQSAGEKGVAVTIGNLAEVLPYADDQFDFVHANQVIEHVPDIDLFAAEIYRVLKPGCSAVISTENGSSWHNVFAVALGWQMFSLSNLSTKRLGIGNPLALHRGEASVLKSWSHKVIFSYRGLREFFEAHGFLVLKVKGAGYYPLPAFLGSVDVRHAAFITVTIQKPQELVHFAR